MVLNPYRCQSDYTGNDGAEHLKATATVLEVAPLPEHARGDPNIREPSAAFSIFHVRALFGNSLTPIAY